MVSYYASSSEPAQIRGKTVYLQYSNRQEIINNKSSGDVPSNVLLVTFEGVEAGDVSIDVLHLVFSAFGFVHKIATFEKTAGFQALVQFSNSETASSARTALDGRSIPRYLLPDHVGTCHLHISFSAHVDLTVKFQSHRSRDYTNPYLPVAPSAMDGTGQYGVGADGKKKEPESNVLLASIENMQYNVTIEVLHTIFSAFGFVQKIAMFEKNAGLQALIQYPDISSAVAALEALEGHCIYEGGYCKLHLSYSRHTDLTVKANNDRSRDYTVPETGLLPMQPSMLGSQPSGPAIPASNVMPQSLLGPQPSGLVMPSANGVGGVVQQQCPPASGNMMSSPIVSGGQVLPNSMYGVPYPPPATQVPIAYGPGGHPHSQPSFSGPPPSFSGAPPAFSGTPPAFSGASPAFSGTTPPFPGPPSTFSGTPSTFSGAMGSVPSSVAFDYSQPTSLQLGRLHQPQVLPPTSGSSVFYM
ncbi:hypothetical protein KP509_09G093000 [Ceratopteris richardii]|nr:hypothetical protein KP509_09G093000 [Ceratopteris richardii]